MKRIAVFPGSFDPITIGHYSIVKRALPLFDEIIVGIGNNASKNYMFSLDERRKFIESAFEGTHVTTKTFDGLTVDFCKAHNANFILRGLRNGTDFEFEKNIAQMNKSLNDDIETVILVTEPDLSAISSTIVRDIIRNGGDVAQFLPPGVKI